MARAEEQAALPTLDSATYNRFVAGVQPIRMELGEVSAQVQPSDTEQITLQVDSQFETRCLQSDAEARTFVVEAQLQLGFLTEGGEEVGQFRCMYRMAYQSVEELSEGVVDQFVRRNAPLHVWPFMRELVLNLTQRFGWAGFMLPSFLIPPAVTDTQQTVDSGAPVEGETEEKVQRKPAKPRGKKAKA
ncbi:hypothetical protein [Deinococcus radiophilus]|uniref:Preprotein translocase subunit SecB n=1 Tax=Deinococcus radiophilus TaxID=32062 RepID=A0A431VF13_9DEIO|nr:hypothetical protein [Deinococcus radiophilus]RTR18302.1 hypothetical protein EJ104_13675 [Deinococcus radiophilus]UFA51874.1 hypothetical protein LMT64_12580 [Deinococcus radiophilus]